MGRREEHAARLADLAARAQAGTQRPARAAGRPVFDLLSGSPAPDVAWIVRENLKKARMR